MKSKEIMKEYENEYGKRITLVESNKDVFGKEYYTWRFSDEDLWFNIPKENFKNMIKDNHYKEIK